MTIKNDKIKTNTNMSNMKRNLKINMVTENLSVDFRLKKIHETRTHLLDEIKHD